MAEDDVTPDPGEQQAEVEIDGELVTGTIPAAAAESVEERRAARTGWYRSPGGHIAHAGGPDQKRAFADRGWTAISEDDAKAAIADGLDLTVDRTEGTFDAEAVQAAVKNESTSRPRRPRRG